MEFLLDTNVLSEAVKTDPEPNVLDMMKRHQNAIATAAPVWHELKFGCLRLANSIKKAAIETFLNEIVLPNIPVLSYDMRAADWHAAQRERLTSLGKTPSFVDGHIAAITAVNDLVLVTRNLKDFENFIGLNTVSWHKS